LGPHRIFCGNALAGTSYDNLLGGSKASLIFTDPPYNVTIDGNVGGKGQIHHRTFAMGCGEMTTSGFTSFLTNTFQHLAAHSLDGSIHYTCMDWRHMQEMLAAGYGVYSELKNVCVWNKSNGGMALSIAPSTSWYSSGNQGQPLTSTILSLANTAATAPTFGTMQASTRSVQAEWSSCKCIQP
jgi:DNA modification methylase